MAEVSERSEQSTMASEMFTDGVRRDRENKNPPPVEGEVGYIHVML